MSETGKYRAGLIKKKIKFSSLDIGADAHTFFDIEIDGVRCQVDFYECQTSFGSSTSLRVTPYGSTVADNALRLIEAMVSYDD